MDEPINPIGGEGAISIGLTKLEYFSAMAMQGMLSNSYQSNGCQPLSVATRHQIAELAVDQAKAILKRIEQIK